MDYKLILVEDKTKSSVRYRKTGDSHWNTIELDDTDLDGIITKILKALDKNG